MPVARNFLNTPLSLDSNGSVLISCQPLSGSGGPARNAANTLVKTDANNQLLVAMVGSAGNGVPLIVAQARVLAQAAANASIATYTVGAADGTFEVSENLNIVSGTNFSFAMECAYTDETNSARVLRFAQYDGSGNIITAGTVTNAGGTVAYGGPVMQIRAKAATTITIRTQAAGTYTTVSYNAEGVIKQIA